MISPKDQSEYSEFMHMLAEEADAIARKYFNQSIGYELKADASPVTIADKEIEMALTAAIRNRYPEHGIFGEEHGRHNPDAALQWVIDPIDGTKAFVAGKPTFVTLIALCEDGAPKLGCLSQAIKKQRWLSSELSAEQDDLPETLADAHIATTSIPYFFAEDMLFFQRLEKETSTTLLNHDGLAAGLLADGSIDILIEAALKPYDFAALVPIIEASGGVITDWHGKPLTLESSGKLLAARDNSLHKQALDLLKGAA